MSHFSPVFRFMPVRRWLPFLVAAMLLHLSLIRWALAPFSLPGWPEPAPLVVQAELHLIPLAPTPVVSQAAPVHPAKRAAPTPERETGGADETSDSGQAVAESSSGAGQTVAPPAPAPATPPAVAAGPQPVSPVPLPQYRVAPPPSATFEYRAHSLHKSRDYYGSGSIAWRSDGKTYKAEGKFGVLFFSLLNFSSEGSIDEKYGVSPTVYAEKKIRRSETNTHFHRERNTISFSASTQVYQRQGGEQDRASVVWQLSGIGRHDPTRFAPGATLDIAVAGVRGADVWQFRVIGLEDIETGVGTMRAWRVARSASKNSYERSFDLWLAPQFEWYPVKLRYTESNGDYLDLSLTAYEKTP